MMQLEGLENLEKGFADAMKRVGAVDMKTLEKCALDLEGKAQNLAPLDKGDLKGSSSTKKDGNYAYKVGFEEPYAIKQHEHTEYEHPQGGQAKYLEQPFRENSKKYISDMADAIKNALK